MKRKGILITLEGNEGCGKTTQIGLLYEELKKIGCPVFLTREPGGTRVGDAVRSVLLDGRNKGMTGVCETLLYMASRAQLVTEVVRPQLEKGKVVLCDRWLDATVAYQGYGEGVDVKWIGSLGQVATDGVKPALTIFMDLPLEEGLRRAKRRRAADRIESKERRFHERVRKGYLAIAKKEPRRFRRLTIEPKDSVVQVHEKVKRMVADVI